MPEHGRGGKRLQGSRRISTEDSDILVAELPDGAMEIRAKGISVVRIGGSGAAALLEIANDLRDRPEMLGQFLRGMVFGIGVFRDTKKFVLDSN